MTEASAWAQLREALVKTAALHGHSIHILRVENMVGSGCPDSNICYCGREFWLEGKYMAYLPVRHTTLVKCGMSEDQRVFALRRCLAGGAVYLWVHVGVDRLPRTGDKGWYLFKMDSVDTIDKLYYGAPLEWFKRFRYAKTGDIATAMLSR